MTAVFEDFISIVSVIFANYAVGDFIALATLHFIAQRNAVK